MNSVPSESVITPERTEPLSAQELYLFDTMGYLRIPGLLKREAAELCRSEVLRLPSQPMQGRGDKERYNDLVSLSPALNGLVNSQAVRGLVEPLINQPYRLVESYALRRERDSIFYLHNGNSEAIRYGQGKTAHRNMSLHHTFHNGMLYCMLIKVLVYLSDVRAEEDGPFCYIQGSHKANWPLFEGPLDSIQRPALTKSNFPSLAHVPTETGDCLVLNEALLHGTLPKTSGGERLVMAFSFAPAFVADWKEIDPMSPDLTKLGHY